MNRSELEQEIGRLLGDPNNERWTTTVLDTRINLAQTIIQGYTRAVKTKETLTPTANSSTVTLDADTMDIYRVDIQRTNGDIFELKGVTREELDYRYPSWTNWTAGEPKCYWYDATNQQLNLVPAPDSANAITNGLRVWEIQKPADLSGSSSIPFDSNNQMVPFHLAIVHWVVAQCLMDNATPEALAKAKFHRSGTMTAPGQFENQIGLILGQFDAPEDIPTSILWKPQGGRVGNFGLSKSSPLS